MKGKRKWKKSIFSTFVSLGIMTCIIQIPGEINAQEATIFGEEDYTLQLENYQKELDIDRNEISYNSETDWDWSYYGGNHISKIAKGDNGYYIRLGEYIYFCSFEREKLIPLCVRPDCLHDKEESSEKKELCMAYVGLGTSALFSGIQENEETLYANFAIQSIGEDGKTYAGDDLYSVKKDGSSREKMNLKMENASRFCIQRGNVYYVTHVTDPAKLTETEGVYRVPLDGGNPVPIAEVQGNAIFEIYPYGDFVYGWCGMENVTYLFVYDSKTEKTTARRFEQENILFFIPWEDGFLGMDNGKLFQISSDLKQVEQIGTLLSDDKNEFGISDHNEFWLYSFLSTDADYFYFQGSVTTQEEIKEFVAIYEKENLELQQIIFVDGMPDSQCIGVDENQIFFTGRTEDGDAVFWLEKETMLEKDVQFHVLQP